MKPPRSWALRALLALVLLVGLYTRLANLGGVFTAGRVFLGPDDAYFHMRRIKAAVAAFPRVPTYDAYTNFPEGATLDWPIGFDLVLASLGKVAQAVSANPQAVEAVAALAVPLLGVLACLLTYFLGRRLGGPAAGVLSALFAAVIPILTGYSIVGRVDHHVIEPLLILGPLLLLLRSLDASGASGKARAAAAGASLALVIAFWPGAFVAGLLAHVSLAASLARVWREEPARAQLLWRPVWTFGVAALLVLPISLLHPWARQGSFAYYAPSWLQPICFTLSGLAFAALALLGRRINSPRAALCLVMAMPVVLGAALLALPAPRDALITAVGYLGRFETQISQIQESRPLLAEPGVLSEQYTLLGWLIPLVLAHALWRARPRAEATAGRLVFAVWLLGAAPLAFAQLRLGSILAPLLCTAWALSAVDLYRWLQHRYQRTWAPRLIVGTIGLLFLLPTLPLHRPVRFSGPRELLSSFDALAWLGERAAPAGDPLQFHQRPAFGTMSRWQWGHFLTYFSRQANIACPLGQTAQNQLGIRRTVSFYLASQPAAAVQELESWGVRYVLVSPLLDELPLLTQHAGRNVADLLAPAAGGKTEVKAEYFLLMNSRLLHFDGRQFQLQGRQLAPLRRLRLVYESMAQVSELGRPLSYCKIFELVPGATLVGSGVPDAVVELALEVITSQGRTFLYTDSARVDRAGRFRLHVPYATSGDRLYRIASAGSQSATAVVTEADVLQGRTIEVRSGKRAHAMVTNAAVEVSRNVQ